MLQGMAERYAESRFTELASQQYLGAGQDGAVWRTASDRATILKAVERKATYERELECYRRFKERGVIEIAGFAVPVLIDYDDGFQVIEMTLVEPPRILDFGKVWIDCLPPYLDSPGIVSTERARAMADYGEDWPAVANLLATLQGTYGIYYADPNWGNICPRHRRPDEVWRLSPSPEIDMGVYDE